MPKSRIPSTHKQTRSDPIYWCHQCRLQMEPDAALNPACPGCQCDLVVERQPEGQESDVLAKFRDRNSIDGIDEMHGDQGSIQGLRAELYSIAEQVYDRLHAANSTPENREYEAPGHGQGSSGEQMRATYSAGDREAIVSEVADRTASLIRSLEANAGGPEGTIGDHVVHQAAFMAALQQSFDALQTRCAPKGATSEQLEKLVRRTVSREEADKGEKCCICLMEYMVDNVVLELVCKHIYHDECILYWFGLSDMCPLCQKSI